MLIYEPPEPAVITCLLMLPLSKTMQISTDLWIKQLTATDEAAALADAVADAPQEVAVAVAAAAAAAPQAFTKQ